MLSFTIQPLSKIVFLMLQSVIFRGCDCDSEDHFIYGNVSIVYKKFDKNQFKGITDSDEETTTAAQMENEVYGTEMNGNFSQSWPTPKASGEKMFLLPKRLEIGDNIGVTGLLREDHRELTLNLVTGSHGIDYSNVALQFTVDFGAENDSYKLYTVRDGNREVAWEETAGKLFLDTNFKFDVTINVNSGSEEIFVFDFFCNDNMLGQVESKHHLADVKYLTMTGDFEKVRKLSFDFA